MKNFRLTFYAFHLYHTLTDAPSEVDKNAQLLWDNLVKLGDESLFDGLKDLPSKLTCYENGVYKPKQELLKKTECLTSSGEREIKLGSLEQEGIKINVTLKPFLLNDTYAVDITLLPESKDTSIDVSKLKYFKPNCLLPSNIQASLGQTLWIYGEVDTGINCQTLAKEFAKALVGENLNLVEIKQIKLFGSEIFEYQATESNSPDNPTEHCHILIVINNSPSPKTKRADDNYEDWLLKLLWCSKRIQYTYHQARQRYQEAKKNYSYLEKQIQEFNKLQINETQTQLSHLKKILIKLPAKKLDYSICLQDLQTHLTTINANINNYKIYLNEITDIPSINSFQFWQEFLDKDCQKFIKQIQTDIEYLSPGQELFGEIVNTIRGLVEIQQAESDCQIQQLLSDNETAAKERERHLDNTIRAFSFGSVATSMGASSSRYLIVQEPGNYPTKFPFKGSAWVDFSLSLLVGILVGLPTTLVWCYLLPLIQSYNYRRDNNAAKNKLNAFLNLLKNKSKLFTDEVKDELLLLIENKPNQVVTLSEAIYFWCQSKTDIKKELKKELNNVQKSLSNNNSGHEDNDYKQKLINRIKHPSHSSDNASN